MSGPSATFTADDWPHGLCCMDCNAEFVEGQRIAQRLTGMTEYADEAAFIVDVVCVGCSVSHAAGPQGTE